MTSKVLISEKDSKAREEEQDQEPPGRRLPPQCDCGDVEENEPVGEVAVRVPTDSDLQRTLHFLPPPSIVSNTSTSKSNVDNVREDSGEKKRYSRGPRPIGEIELPESLSRILNNHQESENHNHDSVNKRPTSGQPQSGQDRSESLPGAYANASVAPFYRRPSGTPPSPPLTSTGSVSHSGLVVANAIDDSSSRRNLPRAEQLHVRFAGSEQGSQDDSSHGNESKSLASTVADNQRCIIAATIIIVIGVSLLLILLVTRNSTTTNSAPHTEVPSASPTQSLLTHLITLFPEETLLALEDPESPQSQAYQWLINDTLFNPNFTHFTNERILQRFALSTLYYATQGHNWTFHDNWLSHEHHECDWYAAEMFPAYGPPELQQYPCHNETGEYQRLWLPANNLNGTLPPEITRLSSLQSLTMHRNGDLSGYLPSTLHQLSNLTKLSFVLCSLYGSIPTQVGTLTQLSILYLSSSKHSRAPRKLEGTIPTELGMLTQLEQLTLGSNHFKGPLPTQLGRLVNLNIAAFQDNQLTSTIPTELGWMPKLWGLHLFRNQLTGTIPTQLASSRSLKELILANNTLVGSIPSQMGQLTDAYMMFLAHNANLTGSLPSEMARLTKMMAFDVSGTEIDPDSVPEVLQQAQDSISFHRYFFDCGMILPCSSA